MKIAAVNKTNRSISFKYNPMQQRVAKYVKPTSSTAEKRTYYIRDAQGNVMAVYTAKVTNNSGTITWDTFYLTEQHLYGSNRLGLAQTNVKLYPGTYKNPHLADSSNYAIFEGWKRYELTNHLGNVLAVVSDRKIGKSTGSYPGPALWYEADVLSTQQYYPFGMLMPGRQYAVGSYDYRYGFNGKEGDDEVKGDDNQQDYGMRIYDPRVGRFLSVDPLSAKYPWYTPYQFAGNMPILAIDIDGLEPNKNPNQDGTPETVGKGIITAIGVGAEVSNISQNGFLGLLAIPGETVKNHTNNYVTDTDDKSADRFNMYVNTTQTLKVDESNAGLYKNYESYIVAKLMSGFVGGYGAENYEFPENGIISSKFLNSDILHEALGRHLAGEELRNEQIGFGFSTLAQDTWRNGTIFSITGLAGSGNITITPTDAGIQIKIFNITSLTSGAFGKEAFGKDNYPASYVRNPGQTITFGNISQTFNLFILNENKQNVYDSHK